MELKIIITSTGIKLRSKETNSKKSDCDLLHTNEKWVISWHLLFYHKSKDLI